MPLLRRRRASQDAPTERRSRRRAVRRLGLVAAVGGIAALRQRKLAENQRRFDLP